MRSTFLVVLGLLSGYPTMAAAAQDSLTLREECTRDRCVYYHGSTREFSVEKEYQTDRLVVRNGQRDIVAKITRQDNGTVKVERARRRR
jgi:hypothetical protein